MIYTNDVKTIKVTIVPEQPLKLGAMDIEVKKQAEKKFTIRQWWKSLLVKVLKYIKNQIIAY